MKRNLFFLAVAVTALVAFSSCRSHKSCPAYGKVNSGVSVKNA